VTGDLGDALHGPASEHKRTYVPTSPWTDGLIPDPGAGVSSPAGQRGAGRPGWVFSGVVCLGKGRGGVLVFPSPFNRITFTPLRGETRGGNGMEQAKHEVIPWRCFWIF